MFQSQRSQAVGISLAAIVAIFGALATNEHVKEDLKGDLEVAAAKWGTWNKGGKYNACVADNALQEQSWANIRQHAANAFRSIPDKIAKTTLMQEIINANRGLIDPDWFEKLDQYGQLTQEEFAEYTARYFDQCKHFTTKEQFRKFYQENEGVINFLIRTGIGIMLGAENKLQPSEDNGKKFALRMFETPVSVDVPAAPSGLA